MTPKQKEQLFAGLPKKVTQKDFNRKILPHLRKPVKGPAHKISLYKIFNYILHVMHTGIQWEQLRTYKNEIHWSNVYKWHNRWSKDGSYLTLFLASILDLHQAGKLDLSVLHGDGSNTIAKKGGLASDIPDTSIRRVKKSLPL